MYLVHYSKTGGHRGMPSKSDRDELVEIKTLKDKEKELLQVVLVKTKWNLEKTSRLLQIPLSQVKQKIREHGLKPQGN